MTTYDDGKGTQVQPGDYVRAEYYRAETPYAVEAPVVRDEQGFLWVWGYEASDASSIRKINRPAEPRPPLPTHLGAVVWVGVNPFFRGGTRDDPLWLDQLGGSVAGPGWLALQDWTSTPPEAS